MSKLFTILAALALVASLPFPSFGSDCAGTAIERKAGTDVFVLECRGSCTPTIPCSPQSAAGTTIGYWCGCNQTEPGCCPIDLADGEVDEQGRVLGSGVQVQGDCVTCPLSGVCEPVDEDAGSSGLPEEWTAACITS